MLEAPAEADDPEEESTRGALPPTGSPSGPEYEPMPNSPPEADVSKEESSRGACRTDDFPLRRLAWPLRLTGTLEDAGGGEAAQPEAEQPPHTTHPSEPTSMRSAHVSTDT